jgi:hypothetical protein
MTDTGGDYKILPKAVAKTLANEIKVRTPFAIYIKVKIGTSKT